MRDLSHDDEGLGVEILYNLLVMEQNEPHALFASPQNPRLKSFLSKVL